MVPLGIQFATSANVGQQIGSGNIPMAKKHAITHVSFAIFIMTIIMVCIKIFEQGVARIFTEDPEDVFYILEVLDLISAYLVLDSVHGVNTGIVRALGKQFPASVATLCCYYALGLPLALAFGFKFGYGVRGFWLGFTVALALQDVIVTLIIIFTNWQGVYEAIQQQPKVVRQESERLVDSYVSDEDEFKRANTINF